MNGRFRREFNSVLRLNELGCRTEFVGSSVQCVMSQLREVGCGGVFGRGRNGNFLAGRLGRREINVGKIEFQLMLATQRRVNQRIPLRCGRRLKPTRT